MSKVWDYKSNNNDKLAKKVIKDPTIVMTKPDMARNLIALVDFKDGDRVIDPCRGDGAFYDNLPDNVIKSYCEINENKDYLEHKDKVDITLSNPPFVPRKLFWNFMQVAMDTTDREIYWLINMCSLNVFTPKRLLEMKDKNWFINHFHIVADKRWFGRYVWVKISKIDNDFISYKNNAY